MRFDRHQLPTLGLRICLRLQPRHPRFQDHCRVRSSIATFCERPGLTIQVWVGVELHQHIAERVAIVVPLAIGIDHAPVFAAHVVGLARVPIGEVERLVVCPSPSARWLRASWRLDQAERRRSALQRWCRTCPNEFTFRRRSNGGGISTERHRRLFRLFKGARAIKCIHGIPVPVAALRHRPLHRQARGERCWVAKRDIDFTTARHALTADADQVQLASDARHHQARGAAVANGIIVIARQRHATTCSVDHDAGVKARMVASGDRQTTTDGWHHAEPHIVGVVAAHRRVRALSDERRTIRVGVQRGEWIATETERPRRRALIVLRRQGALLHCKIHAE